MLLSKIKMLAALLCVPFVFAVQPRARAGERVSAADLRAAQKELSRQADAEAIAKAFRKCLRDPELAAVITSALETQVYSNKALGFVNGYWAKPINLSAVYAEADVAAALAALLADKPSALARLNDAVDAVEHGQVIDPDVGAGIVFIPHGAAMNEGMMDLIGLTESIAGGGFLGDFQGLMELGANDFIITLIISVAGSLIAGAIMSGCDDDDDRFGPDGDFDGDGLPNKYDADDDNDGTEDGEDRYPFDRNAQNTPCPPPGACLTAVQVGDAALSAAVSDIVNESYVGLTEASDLMSVQTESSVGMVFSFPGM